MLDELERLGWERDTFADVIFDSNELYFSYSHPEYPRCSLIICIRLNYFSSGKVRPSVSTSLCVDGEEVMLWYDDTTDIASITAVASEYQQENNNGSSSACGY